jgi:hypothetical protein
MGRFASERATANTQQVRAKNHVKTIPLYVFPWLIPLARGSDFFFFQYEVFNIIIKKSTPLFDLNLFFQAILKFKTIIMKLSSSNKNY